MRQNKFILTALLFMTGISFGLVKKIPHEFMKDESRCEECHISVSQNSADSLQPAMSFHKSVTEMCTECHGYGEESHPTDMDPDFTIPNDLPMKEGNITCITCHQPHLDYYSDRRWVSSSALSKLGGLFSRKKKFRTYFLRRNNAHGELCLACHRSGTK